MNTEVLLMAYGGPDSLEDVPAYLLDVRGGRPTPPHLVADITERYRRIGGGSPILHWTRSQAEGLARRSGLQVRVGMRHWHPYIEAAVQEARAAGAERLIAIPMSPFYSRMSIGAYAEKLRSALPDGMEALIVHSWFLFPPYLAAVAETVQKLRAEAAEAAVIFTAHSLPQRLREDGDPYDAQLRAAAGAVARMCGIDAWTFAYQSPGRTPEPWMGPFVEDVLRELVARDERNFLLVPIGFVCDHVEVLYDIDVVLRELMEAAGASLRRTESLNDRPGFIAALAGLVEEAQRPSSPHVTVERV